MDANKFMTEYQRMCASYTGCRDCPLYTDNEQCIEIPSCFTKEFTDKVIKIVEEWSAAHPRKTRQSKFLEQYPEARTDTKGILRICPKFISADWGINYGNCKHMLCSDCRISYWSQEID